MSDALPVPDATLARYLGFDGRDLHNNRRGILTGAQGLRLVGHYRRAVRPLVRFALGLIALWGLGFVFIGADFGLLTGLLGLLPVMLVLLWRASQVNRPYAQDIEAKRARQIIGEWVGQHAPDTLIFRDDQFKDHHLIAPHGTQRAFQAEIFYRVYFAQHTSVIVAAEPLAG